MSRQDLQLPSFLAFNKLDITYLSEIAGIGESILLPRLMVVGDSVDALVTEAIPDEVVEYFRAGGEDHAFEDAVNTYHCPETGRIYMENGDPRNGRHRITICEDITEEMRALLDQSPVHQYLDYIEGCAGCEVEPEEITPPWKRQDNVMIDVQFDDLRAISEAVPAYWFPDSTRLLLGFQEQRHHDLPANQGKLYAVICSQSLGDSEFMYTDLFTLFRLEYTGIND